MRNETARKQDVAPCLLLGMILLTFMLACEKNYPGAHSTERYPGGFTYIGPLRDYKPLPAKGTPLKHQLFDVAKQGSAVMDEILSILSSGHCAALLTDTVNDQQSAFGEWIKRTQESQGRIARVLDRYPWVGNISVGFVKCPRADCELLECNSPLEIAWMVARGRCRVNVVPTNASPYSVWYGEYDMKRKSISTMETLVYKAEGCEDCYSVSFTRPLKRNGGGDFVAAGIMLGVVFKPSTSVLIHREDELAIINRTPIETFDVPLSPHDVK